MLFRSLTSDKSSGDTLEMLLVDPQTSGGLLIAAPAEATLAILQAIKDSGYPLACHDIGEIVEGKDNMVALL